LKLVSFVQALIGAHGIRENLSNGIVASLCVEDSKCASGMTFNGW
jgi:hypothetical protein